VAPQEAIAPEQALALYTRQAAYAAGMEATLGTLEPGKLADLVLLSRDPTRGDPQELLHTQVLMTVLGGQVVYQA